MRRPLIGISPRVIPASKNPIGPRNRSLHCLEPSLAYRLFDLGAVPVMVPTFDKDQDNERFDRAISAYVEQVDGLILQGGVDISPILFGESPRAGSHETDLMRDLFELELFRRFYRRGKPILGICRGCQLINIALGGTLCLDIVEDIGGTVSHRNQHEDENNFHEIEFLPDGVLRRLYGSRQRGLVNSIHHQAIKKLGAELAVEASSPDGVVEAISGTAGSYLVGVQWHPEFMSEPHEQFVEAEPLFRGLVEAATHD